MLLFSRNADDIVMVIRGSNVEKLPQEAVQYIILSLKQG